MGEGGKSFALFFFGACATGIVPRSLGAWVGGGVQCEPEDCRFHDGWNGDLLEMKGWREGTGTATGNRTPIPNMNTSLLLSRVVDAEIPCGKITLEGDLRIPDSPDGLVVFAHGSGSSRLSPRNQYVAQRMRDHGFATLLFDMLTESETEAAGSSGRRPFDLGMLTGRVLAAIRWAQSQPSLGEMPLGIFGSSTGAATALAAAALLPKISAVVCRGGRMDLVGNRLGEVTAPTLFIAGSEDVPIVRRNRVCIERLGGIGKISIIPGAGHLFEERGTLEEASRVAGRWFADHMRDNGGKDN